MLHLSFNPTLRLVPLLFVAILIFYPPTHFFLCLSSLLHFCSSSSFSLKDTNPTRTHPLHFLLFFNCPPNTPRPTRTTHNNHLNSALTIVLVPLRRLSRPSRSSRRRRPTLRQLLLLWRRLLSLLLLRSARVGSIRLKLLLLLPSLRPTLRPTLLVGRGVAPIS